VTVHRIAERTWPEYESLVSDGVPVILPVGATEQHGHHLPLGTDAIQVDAVAAAAAATAQGDVLVAPVLSYGYKSMPRTGGGEIFPGTISLDASTLVRTIQDVLRQLMADGVRRIVVLGGHYENSFPILEAIDLALRERHDDWVTMLSLLWTDLVSEETLQTVYPGEWPGIELEHAAWFESSMMMHLRPDLVHIERAGTEIADFPPYDVHPQRAGFVPATGSLTRSDGADAKYGEILLNECAAGLATLLDRGWDGESGR
jgi:creatinine amidohydrolase